jgi:sirohydrochlorin cobaltochelatase
VTDSQRLLEALIAENRACIGQLAIVPADGGFVLCHRDDLGRADLKTYEIDDALEIAKFDDAGNYRPLKTAPNLRHHWKIFAHDLSQLEQAIDVIYPARLAILHAFKSGQLTITPLRETLNRQSGMYRVARSISDDQLDELVAGFCRSDGGCLRTILWKRDASDKPASSKLPPEKFDPAHDQTGRAEECIPLLCQEACNLLLAACRDAVRGDGAAS